MIDRDSTHSASAIVIRPEGSGDSEGIRNVLVAAFGGKAEADLVQALRHNGALAISLVAWAASEIVGHVGFSPMHYEGQPDREDVLGLAPVAVHPQWQRRGVGSALIARGLEECDRRKCIALFVLGAPGFYGRFGFILARTCHLRCVFDAPLDAFQMLSFSETFIRPLTGLICYRPEFDSFS